MGLERTGRLLAHLGSPQHRYPCVLVAGTNGKGSTAVLLAATAHAAGFSVGLYTSPHLESVEERLRLDGRAIPSARLAALLEELIALSEAREGAPPTYFEVLTLAAFRWFAEEEVDLAVVEVGLGGRLDATNLCEPILSLITSIGIDHREYLGDTLASIAHEKAGILRRGRPALAWIDQAEPAEAVRAVAAELGAHLTFVQEEVELAALAPVRPLPPLAALSAGAWRHRLATPSARYELSISLPGAHQGRNLAVAVRAAEVLAGQGFERLDAAAIVRGAASCRWPGRLESVALPGGRIVLLDGAHNGAGAKALGELLRGLDLQATFLFGVLADKDPAEMVAHLAPCAHRFVLTTPPSPRALAPADLAALLPAGLPYAIEPEPERALSTALQEDDLLVACGSIYLLGVVRASLRRRYGVPAPAVEIDLFGGNPP
jgi:dihydrofolate synthase/folylpolyglutamate synthase